ncbi:MAG: ATP-binding protein [bacterium]
MHSTDSDLLSLREQIKIVQAQLVESEKMATLGQLTAGIAHEIKNPLNFINNFSELSMELVTELEQALQGCIGTLSEKDAGSIKDLLNDLTENLGKINDHGKRADSIIRGMLLHSRGNAAEFMPTPINNLLAEYVNLAYHGMRATDNSFNIKIENDYDATVGNIPAIPQDLSRVFLNILNNAFYSTNEKKKEIKEAYSPLLTVSTRDIGQMVEIRLRDNGKGIPPVVMEKIFNAFFTTKPAGLGTGLGLSISHDIIEREHKGEIRVDSVEGEWAEFIIKLPKQ